MVLKPVALSLGAALLLLCATLGGCTVASHNLGADGSVNSRYIRFMTDAAVGSISKDGDSFLIEAYRSDAEKLAGLLEGLAASLRQGAP